MTQIEEGDMRVWWIRNVPNEPTYYAVRSVSEAISMLDRFAEQDLKDPSIETNAGGLEVLEDGEWSEWYSKEGKDIDELIAENT